MITLNLGNITDANTRQAIEQLVAELNKKEILLGDWDTIIYTAKAAGTYSINHKLKFTPQDVIELSRTSGTVTYNFSSFTSTLVSITTSGALTVRFMTGKQR